MDNGTMVEVFKSLNYCQLAMTSLVSKRFRDLIRNNRHRLALLHVREISMGILLGSPLVSTEIFNKKLSPQEYNEWIIYNQYSKQIPLKHQVAKMQGTRRVYELYAYAGRDWKSRVFFVRVNLNNENWPLFQHFIRLLTDPFIYLYEVEFDWMAQKDCFNLLTGIINPDRNCLQCHKMRLFIKDTILEFSIFITWVKCHLLSDKLEIFVYGDEGLNPDEALTNFILTGGHCTSAIWISGAYEFSNVLGDLVEKFMKFKKGDECQVIQSIKGYIKSHNVEMFKRNLGQFIVKDEIMEDTELLFEFINKDIDQKFQFTVTYF